MRQLRARPMCMAVLCAICVHTYICIVPPAVRLPSASGDGEHGTLSWHGCIACMAGAWGLASGGWPHLTAVGRHFGRLGWPWFRDDFAALGVRARRLHLDVICANHGLAWPSYRGRDAIDTLFRTVRRRGELSCGHVAISEGACRLLLPLLLPPLMLL